MLPKVTVTKIERTQDAYGWKLIATMSNGSQQVFGFMMKERGSKSMLTRRAKQFGLVVNGDVAEAAK